MNPLFVADTTTLKAALRLTGVPDGSADTHAIIDDAIGRARLAFYDRLGTHRVADLLAIPLVADPASSEELLRLRANHTEIRLVQVELFRRLPSAFMDASGDIRRRWNEEAPFRERGRTDLEREIERLLNDIEQDMQMLAGEEALGEEIGIETFDGTPDFCPPKPGDTLLGSTTTFLSED